MTNTYTQIHIHIVFAVRKRECLIQKSLQEPLYKYVNTIINNNGHKTLCIGGTQDHIHILLGLRPNESLSHLVQEIKKDSSKWINSNGFLKGHFEWQEGYGAFSYAKSQIPAVVAYIENQEQHHKRQTFIDEYKQMLEMFNISYDEKYIFKPLQ